MIMPYVALGDSYAAGVGAGDPTCRCHRSDAGYPVGVARRAGLDLSYQACLGATIGDVVAGQLGDLGQDTELVTVTVGGNDAGFTSVLVAAAEPAWMSQFDRILSDSLVFVRQRLAGELAALYAELHRRAPRARIVATGYPRLFNGTDCELITFFSESDLRRLDDAADELVAVLASAAEAAGSEFVDVRDRFTGHAVCDPVEWVRGVSWPVEESFHPNSFGHAAYTAAVETVVGGQEAPVEPTIVHGPMRAGSAPTFALPDLLSGRSRRGASALGLDPEEVRALAPRALSGDPTVAGDPGAVERLHELDRIAQARKDLAQSRTGSVPPGN